MQLGYFFISNESRELSLYCLVKTFVANIWLNSKSGFVVIAIFLKKFSSILKKFK